ncbi:hypothetical protein U1E44_14740 [Arenibacter sp. GZD96]|uniref:hypothetical protein n=1 Tax=Aurantibrevibacter litoralis TaxID=3106030 RepID=UPI002AFED463|nr:hypothetical protein [Arenibacter sp. GZD-96]MEA1787356.1 hypothetical protein [Arenibacter sp. GZD-96]
MKKLFVYFVSFGLVISCSGVKKTQEALNTGNYGSAITSALQNLAGNKDKKSHQRYILMLEEAFYKNADRELQEIAFLKKDGNPANYERIYTTYVSLNEIQKRITPLLPLRIQDQNRNAAFEFKNYDEKIIKSKNKLSEYLYGNASALLDKGTTKSDFRKAYDDFAYLNEIHPGYADTAIKMETAYAKGLDYVKVQIYNDTEQIIPGRLQDELLNFNTYGLNDLWTQYHANPIKGQTYDFEMQLAFRTIAISPEQVKEKQVIKERQIADGYEFLLDRNGNVVKDSLGNKIKVEKLKTVRSTFYQFTQFKTAQVAGNVRFIDLKTQQQLNTYPLSSEFIFEHHYANYQGDKRALDTDMIAMLNLTSVPFPSNEQMVYDAGEDMKAKLKHILVRHKFPTQRH